MVKGNVVIIGSGIGGLACGAVLAHGGYKVIILEKNSYIGGACSSYEKNGYTFDRAVHLFTSGLNGPYGRLFERLNINYLKFTKHINQITAMKVYKQNEFFPFDININSLFKLLQSKPEKKESSIDSEIKAKRKNPLSALKDMGFNKQTMKDFTKVMTAIMTASKKKINLLYEEGLTVTQWLNQITEDPFIYGIIAFLLAGMFAIGNSKASAAEFLYCFKEEMMSSEGYQYPVSGAAQAIPNAIAKAIQHFGGEVRVNSPVESISIKDDKVQGVMVKDQFIKAPIVVSNLSIKWTILNLVGKDYFEKKYMAKVENLTSSLSSMTFKLALKKSIIEKWGFVNLYHPTLRDWGDKFGPDAPLSNGFFGPVLSNIDPTLAPSGHQAVIFGTLTPSKGPNWERWKEIYWNDICSFFPDVEEKLDFVDISYPKDITTATGKPEGSVEGLGLIPSQVGTNKPSSIIPGVEGLFVVGDTAGKNAHGIGTQLACDSGYKCAVAILEKEFSQI